MYAGIVPACLAQGSLLSTERVSLAYAAQLHSGKQSPGEVWWAEASGSYQGCSGVDEKVGRRGVNELAVFLTE